MASALASIKKRSSLFRLLLYYSLPRPEQCGTPLYRVNFRRLPKHFLGSPNDLVKYSGRPSLPYAYINSSPGSMAPPFQTSSISQESTSSHCASYLANSNSFTSRLPLDFSPDRFRNAGLDLLLANLYRL
jgi:hypothetical protein